MQSALKILLAASLIALGGGSAPASTLLDSASQLNRSSFETLTVFAGGDIADCRKVAALASMARHTSDIVAAGLILAPSARVLTLGDNAYADGTLTEFKECYGPTWGRFRERTLPAPGNHEYHTPGASGYFEYFGALAGPERRGYYSVTVGTWHLVSLDSDLDGNAQQAQLRWLADDLKVNRSRCLLAFWHHPVFSSGEHGDNPHMLAAWKALVAAGADVILNGHDHDYERYVPQDGRGQRDDLHGVREFVVGTGGAHLRDFERTAAHRAAGQSNVNGVLKLDLSSDSYSWHFLPVTQDAYSDSGTATCHG